MKVLSVLIAALLSLVVFAVPASAYVTTPSLICHTVAASNTLSMTCNVLTDGTYDNLEIYIQARSDSTVNSAPGLVMYANSDTGMNTNYGYMEWYAAGSGSSITTGGTTVDNASLAIIGGVATNSTSQLSNNTSLLHCVMPGFASLAFNKSAICEETQDYTNATNGMYRVNTMWSWHPSTTAAISSLKFEIVDGSHFVSGSEITIYGL